MTDNSTSASSSVRIRKRPRKAKDPTLETRSDGAGSIIKSNRTLYTCLSSKVAKRLKVSVHDRYTFTVDYVTRTVTLKF